SNGSMEKYLQIRPYFQNVAFPGDLQYSLKKYNGPGRHASHAHHILMKGFLRHPLDFLFPFTHQGYFQTWCSGKLSPYGEVLDDDGRNIPVMTGLVKVQLIHLTASANGQTFAPEELGFGIVVDI